MTLHSEIMEQPERLAEMFAGQSENVRQIARDLRERDLHYVFLAARGTSDNAGRYANYLWGAMNGLPLALATPSLFTFYHRPPLLRDALVVGISQSGQSPDIVSVLAEGKRQGCPTLAITNDAGSPLADSADYIINLQTGPELAVAATKTYTAELLAVAMLSAAMKEDQALWRQLEAVPGWIAQVLGEDAAIAQMAQRYRYMSQCVVLGRGFNYSTAFEWALKLKELTYVEAEPYSSADFLHGPIAMIERGYPVMAVVPKGDVFVSMIDLLEQLRERQRAELVIISDSPRALALGQSSIPLPEGVPEWITPMVAIVPAQLFSHHLAFAKGYDTEQPRYIHKVTETR